jgi:putative DNA primase/helicase
MSNPNVAAKAAAVKPFAVATALRLLMLHPDWYFFRIDPGTKDGNLPSAWNTTGNTNDPIVIAKWPSNSNVGIALKKSGLIVADVDVKPGKRGATTVGELELDHGPMPPTYTVLSGSGGPHYYYTETETVKHVSGNNKFGKDIDCPGFVLIAGCEFAGKLYKTVSGSKIGKLAAAPAWFAKYLVVTQQAEAEQIPAIEQDSAVNIEWAKDYLKKDAPPSIQGSNGNTTLLLVAGKLKDRGISRDTATELIDELYNIDDKCVPIWPKDELDKVIDNAYTYLKQTQPGSRTAEADFESDPPNDADINMGIVADMQARLKQSAAVAKVRGIGDNSGGLVMVNLDTVKSRNVDFIWPGRLARGKHTALAGVGGIGKSQITIDIMARVSNGSAWPDRKDILAAGWSKELARAPQGYCIVLSAEDSVDDTILPRLIAAGGNPKFVKFLSMVKDSQGNERKFSLQTDLDRLKKYCQALGNVVLIIVDPASSYMGGDIDAGKNTKVRSVLDPITQLAEGLQCAIVSITHFRKGTSATAVDKVMDSVAFVNAPRAAFAVYNDPDDVGSEFGIERHVMVGLKTNLPGPKAAGLKYHIESVEGGRPELMDYRDNKPIKTSRIVWDGRTDVTADQIAQMENDRGSPKLDEARRFLIEALADGPRPVADVMEAAEAEGLAPDTVKRAKRALKVKATPQGPNEPWIWEYKVKAPELDIPDATELPPE